MTQCYIGLGGNIGNTFDAFIQAYALLKQIPSISQLVCSKIYQTTPVDCYSTQLFLNGVIGFISTLSIQELFKTLEEIEAIIGKKPKAKHAPRIIDIDLLFYGSKIFSNEKMMVPHPRWHQRLFVVTPLADLVSVLNLTSDTGFSTSINIEKMVTLLQEQNQEQVKVTKYEIS